jgi:hypothetical protein
LDFAVGDAHYGKQRDDVVCDEISFDLKIISFVRLLAGSLKNFDDVATS